MQGDTEMQQATLPTQATFTTLATLARRIHARLDQACSATEEREFEATQPLAHMLNGSRSCDVRGDGAEVFENDGMRVTVPTSAVTWKTAPRDPDHARQPTASLKWGSYSTHVRKEDGAEVFENAAVRIVVDATCVLRKHPTTQQPPPCAVPKLLEELDGLVGQLARALEDARERATCHSV